MKELVIQFGAFMFGLIMLAFGIMIAAPGEIESQLCGTLDMKYKEIHINTNPQPGIWKGETGDAVITIVCEK